MSKRFDDAFTQRNNRFVGDDLTDEELDELWEVFGGDGGKGTYMRGWWDDKPHQIAYRLLCRLTRAQKTIADNQTIQMNLEHYLSITRKS